MGTWLLQRPGSLSGFFSAGFWERAVRQGKKKGHLSLSQRMGPRAGKSATWFLWLRNTITILKGINSMLTFAAFASRKKQFSRIQCLTGSEDFKLVSCAARLIRNQNEIQLLINSKKIQIVTHSGPEKGIRVSPGNTQPDQRSELCFTLLRHSHHPYEIKRAAQ